MAEELDDEDLELPEQEFTYVAGRRDRPWIHFKGRWQAMRPLLADILQACGSDRPLRVLDLGSCTGYFSLQAAARHPEADVVAIEGSVGIGNGTAGADGGTRQILSTGAVQTHLRWIQRLQLQNCFVAPEVWDYARICELAALSRPIGDVTFLLSVVHHVDDLSAKQYAEAGLTRLDGFLDLLGKLLLLAPRHFIELPNRPWLAFAYEVYGSARAILQAAAQTSGLQWSFAGPLHTTEWFGQRELWLLEAKSPMPPLDLQTNPFLLLYRGEEPELTEGADDPLNDRGSLDAYDDMGLGGNLALPDAFELSRSSQGGVGAAGQPGGGSMLDSAVSAAGVLAGDPLPATSGLSSLDAGATSLASLAACQSLGGVLVDPGLMMMQGAPSSPADPCVAEAVASAPTDLLVAHLTLRAAVREAEELLLEVRAEAQPQGMPPQQAGGQPAAQPQGRQPQQYHHMQPSYAPQPPQQPHHQQFQQQQYQSRHLVHNAAESAAIAARTGVVTGRSRWA